MQFKNIREILLASVDYEAGLECLSHQFLECPVEDHSSLWWSLQRSCVSADRQLILSFRIFLDGIGESF